MNKEFVHIKSSCYTWNYLYSDWPFFKCFTSNSSEQRKISF